MFVCDVIGLKVKAFVSLFLQLSEVRSRSGEDGVGVCVGLGLNGIDEPLH